MAAKSTSPWIYIGCGCLAMIGLSMATCVGIGFMGYNQVQTFVEEMADPVARNEKAKSLLGAESLPSGYNAQVLFGIPWLMDMVVLSDVEGLPLEGEPGEIEAQDLGDNSLFYFEIKDFGNERQELRDYITGEKDTLDLDVDINFDLDFNPKDVLDRGYFEIGATEYLYATYSGSMETRNGRRDGLHIMTMIECPNPDRLRLSVWFRSYADGMILDEAVAEYADEVTIQQFMSHFAPCND